MGFRRNKSYALRWADGTEFAGLEVEARPIPVGAFEQFAILMDFGDRDEAEFTSEDMREITRLFTEFAELALVSWNVEDDNTGEPVPPTPEGIRRLDFDLALTIVNEWASTMTGVSEDLGKGSSSGGTSPELSLPMEVSSPSLAS